MTGNQKAKFRVFRLAAIYFVTVFAVGFVLGTLRVILLVPNIGARYAELLEIPFMIGGIYFPGLWIAYRSESKRQALGIGFLALAIMLGAEMLLAAIVFRKLPMEALFNKDPFSGTAYYVALLVFAMMPAWMVNRTAPN